jgi:putative addiction module component (TIGR02574 family)
MNQDVVLIEREALSLPLDQRALLVERLFQSLDREDEFITQKWSEEAEKRLDAYYAGKISAVDGPSFVASLRRELS